MNKILKEFCKLTESQVESADQEKIETLSTLTEREKEVLKLVAQGLNNREIASGLFISEATVKSHVANLMGKLNIRDRVEMVLYALKTGVTRI